MPFRFFLWFCIKPESCLAAVHRPLFHLCAWFVWSRPRPRGSPTSVGRCTVAKRSTDATSPTLLLGALRPATKCCLRINVVYEVLKLLYGRGSPSSPKALHKTMVSTKYVTVHGTRHGPSTVMVHGTSNGSRDEAWIQTEMTKLSHTRSRW